MHGRFAADAARRRDPTGTPDIRARFRAELAGRWRRVRALGTRMIAAEDALGLGPLSAATARQAADPVGHFQQWFGEALRRHVLQGDGGWMRAHLDEAAGRARVRALRLAGRAGRLGPGPSHRLVLAQAAMELGGVAG